ncbi:unnamed protein product, partial [Prorocentrum cordatum]
MLYGMTLEGTTILCRFALRIYGLLCHKGSRDGNYAIHGVSVLSKPIGRITNDLPCQEQDQMQGEAADQTVPADPVPDLAPPGPQHPQLMTTEQDEDFFPAIGGEVDEQTISARGRKKASFMDIPSHLLEVRDQLRAEGLGAGTTNFDQTYLVYGAPEACLRVAALKMYGRGDDPIKLASHRMAPVAFEREAEHMVIDGQSIDAIDAIDDQIIDARADTLGTEFERIGHLVFEVGGMCCCERCAVPLSGRGEASLRGSVDMTDRAKNWHAIVSKRRFTVSIYAVHGILLYLPQILPTTSTRCRVWLGSERRPSASPPTFHSFDFGDALPKNTGVSLGDSRLRRRWPASASALADMVAAGFSELSVPECQEALEALD